MFDHERILSIINRLKPFKIELILCFISLVIVLISFFSSLQPKTESVVIAKQESNLPQQEKTATDIYVYISGAVDKPDVYKVPMGTRLKDLILRAGLNSNADKLFFYRFFNQAELLVDEEKIYIPTYIELQNNDIKQRDLIINSKSTTNSQSLLNINSATLDQLDALPGVGKVTAQKIIDSRPYTSLEELVQKSVLSATEFTKIQSSLTFE